MAEAKFFGLPWYMWVLGGGLALGAFYVLTAPPKKPEKAKAERILRKWRSRCRMCSAGLREAEESFRGEEYGAVISAWKRYAGGGKKE